MLNLKIKTTTLMCLSSAKQHQFAVHKGSSLYSQISLMVPAIGRLSYMWFTESATA